jgi:hypothetical protein
MGNAPLPYHLPTGGGCQQPFPSCCRNRSGTGGTMVSAFDDDPGETFTANQSFSDRATFHRVSRNGSQTEPMKLVIAYTVREGEPNAVWP